jgi:hypothetical protein
LNLLTLIFSNRLFFYFAKDLGAIFLLAQIRLRLKMFPAVWVTLVFAVAIDGLERACARDPGRQPVWSGFSCARRFVQTMSTKALTVSAATIRMLSAAPVIQHFIYGFT